MHSNNRSKDATFTLKSCKNNSIETKQQSIVRSSPKSSKHTYTNEGKNKSKKKDKLKDHYWCKKKDGKASKNVIQGKEKLEALVNRIVSKLGEFQKESEVVTLSTTTNITHQSQYRQPILIPQPTHQTTNLLQSLQGDLLNLHNPNILPQPPALPCQQNYRQIFQSALQRPHSLKKMTIKRKNIININHNHNQQQSKQQILLEEVREFRKMQNQNWRRINQDLGKYLGMEDEDQEEMGEIDGKMKGKEKRGYHIIQEKLLKQGRENFRWLQIEDKMNIDDYNAVQNMNVRKKNSTKTSPQSQQNPLHPLPPPLPQPQQAQPNDHPLHNLLLQNYNWQKYIWADEQVSSTSDLQCNSRVLSQSQYLHKNINLDDLMAETNYIQENVDLVLNWILDEFVVELAEKLDFNLLMGFDRKHKHDSNQKEEQNYQQFLSTINQISQDCTHIHHLLPTPPSPPPSTPPKIPLYIIHAYTQTQKNNPTLSKLQLKQKLLKSVCGRDLDISELYSPEEREDQEYMKIQYLYQLDQSIWEDFVMEEVWKMFGSG